MREGYAALAASLPELDGIRVTLLGLHHTQDGSALHVAGPGPGFPEPRPGPLDIDLNFPLSLWLRDSGGRWHAARPDRCHQAGREARDQAPAGAAAGPGPRIWGRGAGWRPVG